MDVGVLERLEHFSVVIKDLDMFDAKALDKLGNFLRPREIVCYAPIVDTNISFCKTIWICSMFKQRLQMKGTTGTLYGSREPLVTNPSFWSWKLAREQSETRMN